MPVEKTTSSTTNTHPLTNNTLVGNDAIPCPLVTIKCWVYNHEPYLRDCLDGFVIQQTNFPFVAIVHDDASTDHSADIIREYAERYPNIIYPIYETENQYSKGSLGRIMDTAVDATGAKYVAMCEGDDYWTDPYKLQKQVDFLESHPEYTFCCHRFKIYDQRKGTYLREYAYNYYKANEDLVIDEKLFFSVWVTQLLTTMMRSDIHHAIMTECYDTFHSGLDVYMYYLLLRRGNGISLNQQMGVYRWHDGGMAIGMSKIESYKKGYIVTKCLLSSFPNDILLYPRLRYYALRYLRFISCCNKNSWTTYKETRPIFDVRKRISAFISFIIFPSIWNFVYSCYSTIRLNKLKI